ncbi:hypothetical protein [Gillisia sp. JM1]|uniref:hypothetical protein n=1 Tax=Gillisia sp. JM1 TaxID=1283286 RepID=UPI0004115830|nr:hypothetical protein [Gillisia sp. JM1]
MKNNKVISLFGNTKFTQNKDVKYSELLEKFIANFKNDIKEIEFIEDIFELAIAACNFGNLSIVMNEKEVKKIIASASEQDLNTALLSKMIDYKIASFRKYTNFIIDYELKGTDSDPILAVITQEEEPYLASMLEDIERNNTSDDFEENYIDRKAIVIKPLQPFFDWINALYPEDKIDNDESNIYLIDENIKNVEDWLKNKYDRFFKMELNEWHANKKEWPQRRNYKMFKQWFQVIISTEIYDLERRPISKIF